MLCGSVSQICLFSSGTAAAGGIGTAHSESALRLGLARAVRKLSISRGPAMDEPAAH